KLVSCWTNDVGDGGGIQVQFGDLFKVETVSQDRQLFFRNFHFHFVDILVDGLDEIGFEFVCFSEIFFEIGSQYDLPVVDALKMAQQRHAIARKLMEVKCMTATFPRDVRLTEKLCFRRW